MQKCKLNFLLRFGLISILLGLFVTQSFAQNVTITGVVKDQSGEPLIGVNVMEKGTTNGSITDVDGKYSVSVKGGKTILVFSYIGYISQEIPVGNQKTLNVTMKEDTEELEEVVVIGYGTAKKKDLTGAISRVKAEKMEVEAPRSVQDLLRASAAGLSISMSTDAAGTADLQVRGKNSLKAGSSPLLVLDGVIYDGSLQDINPMDIESIDVLKDASSVAVYGAKAANGVVAITTKKGKIGSGRITYDGWVGFQTEAKLPETMGTRDLFELRKEAAMNSFTARHPEATVDEIDAFLANRVMTPYVKDGSGGYVFAQYEFDAYENNDNYDWLDAVTRTGVEQNHALSFSGASEKGAYYLSFGYSNKKGMVKNLGDTRYNGRITQIIPSNHG